MSKYIHIAIDTPTDRIVYQRDRNNAAVVPIRGRMWGDLDIASAHARLVAIHPTWGITSATQELTLDHAAGRFSGEITALAGWYRLEVVAISRNGDSVRTGDSVDHVGIGEVFVIFGHSCSQGGLPEDPGAEDDRVNCINYQNSIFYESQLPFKFRHLSEGAWLGPWNGSPHAWALMADRLVTRLNVPVLMMGASFGGTNIEMNYKVIKKIPYEHSFCKYERGMPYRPLSVALGDYAARTGIRAVLVHHGGNDIGSSTREKFAHEFTAVIEHTREAHGFPELAFMLIKEGEFKGHWAGPGEENINAGIADVIKNTPNVFPGPYYGDIPGVAPYKPDAVHLGPEGLPLYAKIWADAILEGDFLTRAMPCARLRE